jgi:excinuclease ABC subunit C
VSAEDLKAKAAALPDKPGIYFFKNAAGEVVYIGKARSLRDRVRTYFLPNADYKVQAILGETADIDYILTGSEREAAFLENNFVQQHQPRFNLRLKDDKSFPYLKLDLAETYPSIRFSRRVEKDGARYFGPFSPASRARTSIHLVNKHFRIRGCEEKIPGKRSRPCLDYDLGLCSAPCVSYVSEEEYRGDAENARLFLEGRTRELVAALRRKMEAAAGERKFEEAARFRDLIRTLEDIHERPRTISVRLEDQDAAGFARRGDAAAVYVFQMRRGKIRSSREFDIPESSGRKDAEILGDVLAGLYRREPPPPRLLLPFRPKPEDGFRTALEASGVRTQVLVPKSGKAKRLVELASRNAESLLDKRERGLTPAADLSCALGLAAPPGRIEGFDISNTGGEESVGSLVVFYDGRPARDEYRKFKIKTVAGPNDVASLKEVIRRRYARVLDEKLPLPDLVMVDGGKGQLSAAEEALRGLGLSSVPLVSLAKKEEILFTARHPDGLRLARTSPALKLVQAVRNEAHRFAVRFHRTRREKKSFASELDGIPGLGPKKKAALLARYGSVAAIRRAPLEELAGLIGRQPAEKIRGR